MQQGGRHHAAAPLDASGDALALFSVDQLPISFSPTVAAVLEQLLRAWSFLAVPLLRGAVTLCMAMSVMVLAEKVFLGTVSAAANVLRRRRRRPATGRSVQGSVVPLLRDEEAGGGSAAFPLVLVQIPMYNEKEVYQLSIGAACRLTWHRSNMQTCCWCGGNRNVKKESAENKSLGRAMSAFHHRRHNIPRLAVQLLTFTRFRRAIHYCRIGGDARWRTATCHQDYFFASLMFVEGTLYGLVCPYFPRLAVVELHDDDSVELSFLGDESSRDTVPKSYKRSWLAECRGELLLVVDVPADHPLFFSPLVYHVYRWLLGERKWTRTASLGGCSLFFSGRQFTGCLGPDHPGVLRDCLYFTSWGGRWSEYSLVDESLREHVADYRGRVEMEDYGPLAWVLPSIG